MQGIEVNVVQGIEVNFVSFAFLLEHVVGNTRVDCTPCINSLVDIVGAVNRRPVSCSKVMEEKFFIVVFV